MGEIVFTPASVLDFLTQIEELKDYDIGIKEDIGKSIQVTIGNSVYSVETNNAVEVSVDKEIVTEVEDVNQDTYLALSDSGEIELEPINSGVIKELAKTLFVGGLVRLTTKFLK